VPDQAWRTLGPKKKPFGYDAALVRMGSDRPDARAAMPLRRTERDRPFAILVKAVMLQGL